MQIIKKNLRLKEVTVKVESAEDLWYLHQLIDSEDLVRGKTERKIKLDGGKGGEERKQTVFKKTVFLEVSVERVEFHKYSDVLRVSGVVVEGPEDVPRGNHHTITVDEGSVVTIKKPEWLNFQLEKLKEAAESVRHKILIVVFDREEAIFALLKGGQGFDILNKISGSVSKKGVDNTEKKNFYQEIIKLILEYDKRHKPKHMIIASPSFWKEYLLKEADDNLKKRLTPATCSEVSENAISEVLKRPEVFKVLESDRAAQEEVLMEKLLTAIAKDMACYGIKECEEKVEIGAVEELMVSYEFLNKARLDDNHKRIERLMKLGEQRGGKVHLLSTEKADKKLHGLGGVAGTLRWVTK
ncbi:mRNA surveillance protein pelota [Candidatus Woesearchaeota archaeon]|nr:mRNA surveillance protein pelota [Candidatus Woesearchaeota archaeon]